MKTRLSKLWKENKSLFIFICLMLVFRSAVADWSDVPTGSMKPTIVEGDRIFINENPRTLTVCKTSNILKNFITFSNIKNLLSITKTNKNNVFMHNYINSKENVSPTFSSNNGKNKESK